MIVVDGWLLSALGAVAAGASCLDAIAGGGGLISMPALLIAGLDPLSALGTNKACGLVGSTTATIAYARRGYVAWRPVLPAALFSGLGGFIGALCAGLTPKAVLEAFIPILLIGVAAFFAVFRLPVGARKPRLKPWPFAVTAAFGLGFYDGVFGPGTGSFFMLAFVTLRGMSLLPATGATKVANAASNLSSLAFFIASGAVVWPIAAAMALGAFLGARLGARLAVRFGALAIRPLIVAVCFAMAIKLLLAPANPLVLGARADGIVTALHQPRISSQMA